MLEQYKIISISHKQVGVNQLGNYQVPADHLVTEKIHLHALKGAFEIEEMIYISTCNRSTFLFYNAEAINEKHIIPFFRMINPDLTQDQLQTLPDFVELYEGIDAVQHIMEVSSSLNSLVVGEREILKQVRIAFEKCMAWNLCGDHLRILMRSTIETAKQVFTQTKIAERPVSIVSLAIQSFLQKQIKKDSPILMVGAGETNTLVAKYLKKHEYSNIRVYNRTAENGKRLAGILNTQILPLAEIENDQNGFDALFICTSSQEKLLTEEMYKSINASSDRKKVIVDLSIPFNTDPLILEKYPVDFIAINSLEKQAEENKSFRRSEVASAQKIIQRELKIFPTKVKRRSIERALHFVPSEIKAIKEKAIGEVYKKELDKLDPESRRLVLEMMDYMEKKCISIPIKTLKEELS